MTKSRRLKTTFLLQLTENVKILTINADIYKWKPYISMEAKIR